MSAINIQNITKPHVTNVFAIKEEYVKQYYPDVYQALENSGSREECITNLYYIDTAKIESLCDDNSVDNFKVEGTRYSYRILDWVFSDKPWLIPDVEELVAEGFIQENNIRSCFLPEDNYYWVSIDYSAEELRIAALLSNEPTWVNTFSNSGDIHKETAYALWGKENYTKDKRKLAKRCKLWYLIWYGGKELYGKI